MTSMIWILNFEFQFQIHEFKIWNSIPISAIVNPFPSTIRHFLDAGLPLLHHALLPESLTSFHIRPPLD